ncbi:MAG TPA: hypothetical protein VHW93_00420 [Acidimicrobiales bacterium]|nr:hypothetical protein [Acidimicrobiales bacterium]
MRSYGIYLYGLTLLVLVPAVTHLPLHEVVPVDLVAMAVVVALSYRYMEAPLRARGRAWLARTDDDRADALAQGVTLGPPRAVPSLPVVGVG